MNSNSSRKNNNINSDAIIRILFENKGRHGICILDSSGNIINWNKTAEELFGYNSREVINKNYSILFSKEYQKKRTLEKRLNIVSKKGLLLSEDQYVKKDNTVFWGSTTLSIAQNKSKVPYFVMVTENIDRRKEIERQKGEYIRIASHELRTPISALILYCELLEDRISLENDTKTSKLFQDLKSQIGRLANLVEDLLVISEVERKKLSLNKKVFDINNLVKIAVKTFQGTTLTHKIIVQGKIKEKVLADDKRILQVLINLIANGIKYSPKARKILINLKKKGQKVFISIQDFGDGISPKEQKEIFSPYFRSYSHEKGNIPGLGLGLYISREIIKKHNEKLFVNSEKGKGSTFTFTLPIYNI